MFPPSPNRGAQGGEAAARSTFGSFLVWLMRQCIDHDIDAHREGLFERELPIIGFFFALAFPAVPQISIVTEDSHQSVLIVEHSSKVNFLGVRPFPGDA